MASANGPEDENNSTNTLQENRVNNDERPIAIVRRFRPTVKLSLASESGIVEAERASQLFDSDTLVTADNGYAVVQFMDNSVARVQPNSVLIVRGEVQDQQTTAARLALELGEVFLDVNGDDSDYEVATSSAVAAVKGTEFISESHEDGSSSFIGLSGEVELSALNSDQIVTLGANNGADIDSEGNEINQYELSDNQIAELKNSYETLDESTEGESLRLEFENDEGELREFELQYNDNNN